MGIRRRTHHRERQHLLVQRSAVQITAGLVTENYIHDPGYISGDHTNGVISNAGGLMTISQNTILISQEQTGLRSRSTTLRIRVL